MVNEENPFDTSRRPKEYKKKMVSLILRAQASFTSETFGGGRQGFVVTFLGLCFVETV